MRDALKAVAFVVALIAVLAVLSTGMKALSAAHDTNAISGIFSSLMFWALLALGYFLPTLVARGRLHRNALAIGMLNLFLGWTFLGWVVALVWACTDNIAPRPTAVQQFLANAKR